VAKNEYIYRCKDIPCNAYCSKSDCRKREFGLGKDKGHFTGIDYGQLYRYNSAEPYYIWKLRLQGQDNWKDVIFKDEGFLLDQKNFAKMCVRYLNQAPMQVSANDWYAILNSVLPNIQDIKVDCENDTSRTAIIRTKFIEYLANKQAGRNSPYQIHSGLCFRKEENGIIKYYFKHQGFEDYLRNKKIDFDLAIMREMLKSFGAKEDILVYDNASGEQKKVVCWSKEDDSVLSTAYADALEVLEGDRALSGVQSISEVDEEEQVKGKGYTEKDKQDAEEIF
jgi:hypothetical protein